MEEPITREEQYLAAIAGGSNPVPDTPITRTEQYLAAILEGGSGADLSVIAPEYDPEDTYAEGDLCTHEGKLYKANQAISTAEEWDETHWTETDIATELADVVDPEAIAEAVGDWLGDHVDPETGYVVDDTLSIADAAADAKKTGDEIADLKSAITNGQVAFNVAFNAENDGHFIASNGAYSSNQNYSMTDPIEVKKGYKILFTGKGYNAGVAMIAAYDGESYTALVVDDGSNVAKEYSYVATEDITVVMSYNLLADYHGQIILETYNYAKSIDTKLDTDIAQVRNAFTYTGLERTISFSDAEAGYVQSNGIIAISGNFKHKPAFKVYTGQKIIFNAHGYSTGVAMVAEDVGTSTYNVLVLSIDSTDREYTYVAPRDMYIVLSYNANYDYSARVISNTDVTSENAIPFGCGMLFPNLAVIGDSLSSGCLVPTAGDIEYVYGDSWLSYIARKINAISRNHYSQGGLSAKSWLNSAYLTKMQSDAAANAYFIALGTNDFSNETYPLGTIDDEAGDDSFVGYYKQIINAVRTKAPNSAIFCVSVYGNDTHHHTYSNMISDIADLYDNCFYIDFINNTAIYISTGGVWSANAHFTTIGYKYVAEVIYKLMNDVVIQNGDYFKWFGENNSVGGQYTETN